MDLSIFGAKTYAGGVPARSDFWELTLPFLLYPVAPLVLLFIDWRVAFIWAILARELVRENW